MRDMAVSQTPFWVVLALSIAVPLATIALVVLVVRALARARREAGRLRTGELFRLLGARLAGRIAGRDLRRAAARTEHEPFWDAVETMATHLRPRERRELARELARSSHLARERTVLLSPAPPERRERAAQRLGLLPDARSRTALRRALVGGPPQVTFAAARALARHRDLRALRWVLEHPQAVGARPIPALSGMLRAFGPAGRSLLLIALQRGLADTRLECACVDALGLTRCRSARGAFDQRLSSPHLEVRVSAARALGRLGMAESTPALLMALTDAQWPVRAIAAQALGRLGASPAVDALADRLTDRAWWVRRHAAYALAAIGGDGVDALCEVAARSPDPYAREMAREALDHGEDRARA